MKDSWRVPRPQIVFLVLVLAAVWLPRGFALDRYVTTDEPLWLSRSANFYYALSHGDLAGTFQREHPGVTVTWAGAAGFLWRYPAYAQEAPGQFDPGSSGLESFLRAQGREPIELLAAGRTFMVLAVTAVLGLAFLSAVRLVGLGPALLGFLLVAFDPFLVAHSRLLHLDGLLSSLLLLSLLALLNYIYSGRRRRDLLLSGVAAGLAWLTKTPALILVPVAGLLLLLGRWPERRGRWGFHPADLRALIVPFVAWAVTGLGLFLALWPAMWVDPVETIRRIVAESTLYATVGHFLPVYFEGAPVVGDPGPRFYPVNLLWRVTPVTLLGVALAVASFFRRRPSGGESPSNRRIAAGVLLLVVALFILAMTMGAKKADRYILPVFAPLDLVAGIGWVAAARWLGREHAGSRRGRLAGAAASALVGVQIIGALQTHPYYLSYYNPLLGGSARAPEVMWVGWGEGLDEVARALNARPDASKLSVMSWYARGPLSYFFKGKSSEILPISNGEDLQKWLNTDYLVLYVNQWQRELQPPELRAYLDSQEPEEVIRVDNLEYARVYNLRAASPFSALTTAGPQATYSCPEEATPAALLNRPMSGGEPTVEWSNAIRLIAADLPVQPLDPGERFQTAVTLQNRAPIDRNLSMLLRVVGPDGREWLRDEGWPRGAPTTEWERCELWTDTRTFTVPAEMPPGYYRLELSFYDPDTRLPLPAAHAGSGAPLGETVIVDYLTVGDLPSEPGQRLYPATDLGDAIRLLGHDLVGGDGERETPAAVGGGESVTLRLFWQAKAEIASDYTVFVHLAGPDGQIVAQHDQQPLGGFYPTSAWKRGETIVDEYHLSVPPDLPAGEYQVRVGMYTLATGERLPVRRAGQPEGDSLVLATLHLRAE